MTATCPDCGPGYRYGDDGCSHAQPEFLPSTELWNVPEEVFVTIATMLDPPPTGDFGLTENRSFRMAVEAAYSHGRAAALASREAPRSTSDDPLAELRDIIAECLYEAANTDEQGPGGSVKHWGGWADEWLMGRVSEWVGGVVASREAQVRRYQRAIAEVAVLHEPYRGIGDMDSCAECSRVAGNHVPFTACRTRAALRDDSELRS